MAVLCEPDDTAFDDAVERHARTFSNDPIGDDQAERQGWTREGCAVYSDDYRPTLWQRFKRWLLTT